MITRNLCPLNRGNSTRSDADISTNVNGDMVAERPVLRRFRFAEPLSALADPSRHFHHDSDLALTPLRAANSRAVSPLAFHFSTRFAYVSRLVRPILLSGRWTYATLLPMSGTCLGERIRRFSGV